MSETPDPEQQDEEPMGLGIRFGRAVYGLFLSYAREQELKAKTDELGKLLTGRTEIPELEAQKLEINDRFPGLLTEDDYRSLVNFAEESGLGLKEMALFLIGQTQNQDDTKRFFNNPSYYSLSIMFGGEPYDFSIRTFRELFDATHQEQIAQGPSTQKTDINM